MVRNAFLRATPGLRVSRSTPLTVRNVHHHLAPRHERVRHQVPRANGNGRHLAKSAAREPPWSASLSLYSLLPFHTPPPNTRGAAAATDSSPPSRHRPAAAEPPPSRRRVSLAPSRVPLAPSAGAAPLPGRALPRSRLALCPRSRRAPRPRRRAARRAARKPSPATHRRAARQLCSSPRSSRSSRVAGVLNFFSFPNGPITFAQQPQLHVWLGF